MKRGLLKHLHILVLIFFSAVLLFSMMVFSISPVPVARAAPDVIDLSPIQDNTLYEDEAGSLSNGAGDHFFVGAIAGGELRRGVIAFDIAENIPAGSTIESVTLQLNMSRTSSGGQPIELRRLLADWGEGSSNAPGQEGGGDAATSGDATWVYTFFQSLRLLKSKTALAGCF